jgi:MoxR-like ATPase
MKSIERHQNTAALLEAMQERSVTIAGENYKLDLPYFFWLLKIH